jgi:hypothetical protein
MDVTNGSSIREPYVSLVESHGLIESHYLESCILTTASPAIGKYPPEFYYGDTNHGDLYRKAYREVIKKPKEEFLVTLSFFSNRTFTDRKGRLTLEPLIYCPCSLFNLKARQLHEFWQFLGYLPHADSSQYVDAAAKVEDYHYALTILLNELHSLQHSNHPLVLDLIYTKILPDGSIVEVCHPQVKFLFRILSVTGDSEGQDKQCAKISCKGPESKEC